MQKRLFVLIFPFFLFLHVVSEAHAATFQMQTGYYIGTGASLSITGLGFQPNLVIIKADTNAGVGAVWTSSAMASSDTGYFTATAKDTASQITLNSDGFTVSSGVNVNTVGVRWTWIAFGGSDSSSSGTFCVGSYTGDGSASRSITSGFQPDLVWVKAETNQSAVWCSSAMGTNTGQFFTATAQITNGTVFKTLDTTGFTIGNAAQVNTNSVVYQYVAFKNVTGAMKVGSYTGNEVDNRNITGVGFTPDLVFIKNAPSAVDAVYNLTESYEDYSSYFTDTANTINHIQLLQSDGFQVGSNSNVNGSGNAIYWAAFGGAVNPTPSGSFKLAMGSYSGNGTSQSVTGLGFTPDLVIVKHTDQATDQYAVFRTSLMYGTNATAYLAAASATFASGITSLNSDGFSVGTHTTVNTSGDTYYWEAFGNAFNPLTNSGAANFAIGAYTASEIDNRNISRIGFQPDFLTIKSQSAALGTWRTTALSGDLSSFFGATAEAPDNIQALNTDGFQIGVADQVSVAGTLYGWFAFKSGSNFSVNTYSGTGAAQDITTAGFQPDLVWVKRATAVNGVFRSSSLTGNSTQYFTNVANVSDRITGFVSNGFSVGGSQTETNVSGGTYRYASWKIPSTLTITATDASAAESGLDTGIFTITRSSENITSALTVNYTVSGSATSGSDYNSIGSSVTIAAYSTTATITVTPIDDSVDEAPETVIVTLSSSSGYVVSTPSSATVTIADNDPPAITISATDPNASEAGPDNGVFTVTRTSGDTSSDLTVNYTVSGTAVSGSDYNSIGTSVTIAASSATATITVTPISDSIDESSETVIVTVGTGSGYTVGTPDSATVNVTDDSFTPTIQFTASSQSRAENIGTTSITAQLSAVSGLDVTLPFTLSGTADNNADYTITASPLTIAAGTTTAAITVTVIDDSGDEEDETIVISMGTPTNATATSPTVHTITITDDDLPPPPPEPVKETLTINSTSPSNEASNVSLNTTVTATFSMLINGQTPTTDTFYIKGNDAKISGSMKTKGETIIFTPSSNLDYNTTYTATITKGVQAANYTGTTLDSEYTWSFTTVDITQVAVSSTSPANGATGVALNSTITVTFSEAMQSSTINTNTFTVSDGSGNIAGTVSYDDKTATFTPSGNLSDSTTYTATITTGVSDLAGNIMASDYTWSFTTVDTTQATVTSTSPANGATGVAISSTITATFSETMQASTINTNTFTVSDGSGNISGTVSYSDMTATFTPSGNLSDSTTYTAKITTGAKDLAGNALASDYTWSFATVDTTRATVTSTSPANGATGVAISSTITATFSEAMQASTINKNTFTVSDGSGNISGTVSYSGTTATFTAAGNLTHSTTYTARISTGVRDLAGNAIASPYTWSFTTTGDADPPAVLYTSPANGSAGVAINRAITAIFSEEMQASTINTNTFTVSDSSGNIAGTVSYSGMTATFTPSSNLSFYTTYTAKIITGARDLAGNAIASPYTWSFTTTGDTVPPTVSSTNPANGTASVAINSTVTATFNEAMQSSTINTNTFTVSNDSGNIAGTVSYSGMTATFTPSGNLSHSTTYTATITSGVMDLAGNIMTSNYTWSFMTTGDVDPPAVSSTRPVNGGAGVTIYRTITATFSEAMQASTINTNTFTVSDSSGNISGTVSYSDTKAIFTPTRNLSPYTAYTARIITRVRDLAGNTMASDYTWSFSTTGDIDIAAPTISSASPANGAAGVDDGSAIAVTFSEEMNASTITTDTFTVNDGSKNINGTISYNDSVATFTPSGNLSSYTTYTAKITTGVRDSAGNALSSPYSWSFSTGLAPVTTPTATPAATVAPTATPSPAPVLTGDIEVSVIDADIGIGIDDADVTIETDQATTTYTKYCQDGFCQFQNLEASNYTVTASAPGYTSESQVATVTGSVTKVVNFALSAVPVQTPTPTLCDAENIEAFPEELKLHRKERATVLISVVCEDGITPVIGETVTAKVKPGKDRVKVSPTIAITDDSGQAAFKITAKSKTGKARVTFKTNNVRAVTKVNVAK